MFINPWVCACAARVTVVCLMELLFVLKHGSHVLNGQKLSLLPPRAHAPYVMGCNSLCACSKNQAVAVSIRRRRFSENATCAEKSCGVQGWQIMCVLCEGKFVTRSTIKK